MVVKLCPQAVAAALLISIVATPILFYSLMLFVSFEIGIVVGMLLYSTQTTYERKLVEDRKI